MSTVILYSTRHGATKKCAELLKFKIFGSEIVDIKEQPGFDISSYDAVILGGSVQAGMVKRELKRFCEENRKLLFQKKLGLYICCMYEGEKAQQQIQMNFPAELCNNAVAVDYFGGIFDFTTLNFFERFIVKMVAGVKESQFNIKEDRITKFAEKFVKILN
ncbi:MAG: flavodoxin domain-containing protein [Candidatus Firestonebacteria bacterium]